MWSPRLVGGHSQKSARARGRGRHRRLPRPAPLRSHQGQKGGQGLRGGGDRAADPLPQLQRSGGDLRRNGTARGRRGAQTRQGAGRGRAQSPGHLQGQPQVLHRLARRRGHRNHQGGHRTGSLGGETGPGRELHSGTGQPPPAGAAVLHCLPKTHQHQIHLHRRQADDAPRIPHSHPAGTRLHDLLHQRYRTAQQHLQALPVHRLGAGPRSGTLQSGAADLVHVSRLQQLDGTGQAAGAGAECAQTGGVGGEYAGRGGEFQLFALCQQALLLVRCASFGLRWRGEPLLWNAGAGMYGARICHAENYIGESNADQITVTHVSGHGARHVIDVK
mmetsp:Transcript_24681/g.56713  ORF Transcript_24681/g.56713 Transcript_24681/m.56713 type:complete len:332 (-) Transcript_24681:455-1450(-)